MHDLLLTAAWAAFLAVGVTVCVALSKRGVDAGTVRNLLHVGAGAWVLGGKAWSHAWVPCAITVFRRSRGAAGV
jgi:hypothetical protein